ncbi:MAG TPA: MFS transporter [Devosia sp.]|nr:MFS transporter [Devosia sp.]
MQFARTWPGALRAMRHYNFRLFFFGQLVSVIGTWMQSTALQWLVYRITGSQTSLGLVTFANFLPVLILSLFMGVVVDRFPRRTLIVFTQTWFMLMAVALAALTWLRIVQFWHILTLSLFLGVANALDMPARQAFVVEMVDGDKHDIMNAIGLNSTLFNLARIIGPAIGGMVVARLGEAPAFAINAVTFLAVITALLLMHLPPPVLADRRTAPLDNLKGGLRYLVGERAIFGLVAMVALFSMMGFGALTLLPVFAKDILHTGAEGFGQMLAMQGIGALGGALTLILFGDRLPKGRMLLLARVLIGPAIAGLALSRNVTLTMGLMVVLGYSFIVQLIFTNTLIQILVPDDLRGRVLSTYTWALGGFYPLGSLLTGFIGDHIGAPNAALLSAVACLGLVVFNLVKFPEMQRL